ncbi:MAG: phenylacetate-CoA ligase [Thermoleophilaceae bacterium]|jgi:phenylacetate-CoA ligase|nr:phenylacetate-CoA ligase [Thermoleophilaceae bacterium]
MAIAGSNINGPRPGTAVAADRLRELLQLVREDNPFQRRRLEQLHLGDAPSLTDLPPLTKPELVHDQERHPPFGTNLTYPLEQYTQLHQTSGTTGPPLRVLDTAADWAWWRERFAHTLTVAGVGPGDRVALTYSFGPHVQFWAAKEALQEVGAMAIALGGMGSTQRLQTIDEVGATAVWCTPTYALRLLEVAVEQRLEAALDSVERVLCTGEPGGSLPGVRARIEEGFGARCFDHAGLTEAGPFGYPCADGHGLHVDEDEFVCEIVDEDLTPTPLGERGELLLTPLRRTGFPVLRYRTGDVVVNTEERCPAGHADRWLPGGIVGRSDDMVVIRGMNVYPSAIEEAVRHLSGSGEFRITFYSEPSGMDEIKLEVELADGKAARELQEMMRKQLGLRVRVVPVTPGVLPRHDGKARRVVDERSPKWSGT